MPQNDHTFALFDPPKMENLLKPGKTNSKSHWKMVGNGDDSLSFLGLKAYFQGCFAWFPEGLSSN